MEWAQKLTSITAATNPTVLWVVSKGSNVGIGLGLIQFYGAQVGSWHDFYYQGNEPCALRNACTVVASKIER